ncbi:MAG: hypothetical protein CVU05_01940 [Bacteroidetes bacterium HGW-Bacteroidetes-21]|jgi:hypothetical protein|nr:MAG: hypothetical protein CVU05_01940 [Bacteroidetes bacterium HGW-Bacteroidetes-21]
MIKNSFYIFVFEAIFLLGCNGSKDELLPDEYLPFYLEQSDIIENKKMIDDIYIKAMYLSPEYMALKNNEHSKADEIMDELKERNNYYYFNLEIGYNEDKNDILQKDIANQEEFFQRVEYLSFKVQNDLRLIVGAETLPCIMAQYERTFGLNKAISIVCMYEKSKNQKENCPDIKLEYYDNFFKSGIVYLAFDGESLCNLPTLKLAQHVK